MLASLFEGNADHSDLLWVIAGVLFVIAGAFVLPGRGSTVRAYASTIGYFAAALLSWGLLFITS